MDGQRPIGVPENGLSGIVVVGGGVVGLAAALRLRRAGHAVTLVDPREEPGPTAPASWGNAGHVAVEQVRPLANWSFLRAAPRRLFAAGGALDLGWRRPGTWLPWILLLLAACARAPAGERALAALLAGALPAWRRLVDDLAEPDLLQENGHLLLWHDAAAGAAGTAAWQRGGTGTARLSPAPDALLDRAGAQLAARPSAGLAVDGTAQLRDPGALLRALQTRFEREGGACRAGRVARIEDAAGSGRFSVVLEDGERLAADWVLVAAGTGARALLRELGLRLPLIAERGYHLEWDHGGGYDLPPLVFEERALIVSRFGARLRAASFVEFTAADAPPDPRKWRRLERHVRALGLPVASGFSRWMGSRPTLPDYLPAIGPVPQRPGLLVACGHQHLGLTLAPLTAELVAALVANATPALDLAPFRPDRFHRVRA